MEQIVFKKEIPVKYHADIAVVGAGPAGIAAAATAAGKGAKVLLLESMALPGGLSTAGRVPILMPYSDGTRILPGGFGEKVLERMTARRLELSPENPVNAAYQIHPENLQQIYEDLLTENGVTILYMCKLAAVNVESGTIRSAVFASPSGMFAVSAEIFIDGTGDGSLAAWSGAPFEVASPEEIMPSTLCSLWVGVDWDAYRKGGAYSHNEDAMLEKLDAAIKAGELSEADYHHTGITRIARDAFGGNISHVFGIDASDERSITQGLIESRRKLKEYERFYRKHIAGFENAEIIDSGSLLGIRESRRIIGDYKLNFEDYKACRSFEDGVGRYNFPADVHPPHPGWKKLQEHKKLFRSSALKRGESYGIPYRILLPQKVENLLVCGRCVSCDRNVLASIRVIPGCWITGQAAGMGAALAVRGKTSPRGVDIKELRSELLRIGAVLDL